MIQRLRVDKDIQQRLQVSQAKKLPEREVKGAEHVPQEAEPTAFRLLGQAGSMGQPHLQVFQHPRKAPEDSIGVCVTSLARGGIRKAKCLGPVLNWPRDEDRVEDNEALATPRELDGTLHDLLPTLHCNERLLRCNGVL